LIAPDEREAYEAILAREHGKFVSLYGEDAPFTVSPLYWGLLESPEMARRAAAITSFFMLAEARGSFTSRRRELVDVVLTRELRTTLVAFMHTSDAIGVGVSPETVDAILAGEHDRLDEADRGLAEYVIAVARGQATAAQHAWVSELMGERAADEYAEFVCCKLMVMRSVQAFTHAYGPAVLDTPWAPPGGFPEDWERDLATLREHVRTTAGHDYDRGSNWIADSPGELPRLVGELREFFRGRVDAAGFGDYVDAVTDGVSTQEQYERLVDALGPRGAAELTEYACFALMARRSAQRP
jgi:alkylhydroperoxidase family enzyme